MNSEKVKEIKEALEQNDDNGIIYEVNDKKRICKFIHHKDILTLINELESEIEILKIQNKNIGIAFDRLEAENERLTERLKQVLLSIDTVKEMNAMCNIAEQRKQAVKEFAEKLKKKLFVFFQDNEELDGKISLGSLYVDVIGVEAEDGTIISLGLIDKLLKEYDK